MGATVFDAAKLFTTRFDVNLEVQLAETNFTKTWQEPLFLVVSN
jgi:hypothetical protein